MTVSEQDIQTIIDSIENIYDMLSQIRDNDFDSETFGITKDKIIEQSGTSTISLANQTPTEVLNLLGI